MWYERDAMKTEVDFSKPIVAEKQGYGPYLLLPNQGGYDWFNIKLGSFNSGVHWATPQQAIAAYSSYDIHNATIKLEK